MNKLRIDLYSKKQIQKTIIVLGIITTVFSLIGPNPGLCIPAFLSLYAIFSLLCISTWINVFSIAFLYQWVQVCIKILYGTFTLTDVHDLTQFPDQIILAYLLSCLALICLSVGMHFPLSRMKIDMQALNTDISRFNTRKVLIFYIVLSLFMSIGAYIFSMVPGLFQVYVVLSDFKWVCFFLLFVLCYKTNKYKTILWLIIIYEFLNGFLSFFADWKSVVFYFIIAWLAVQKITFKQLAFFGIFSLGILYVGILWTGVKGEHRTYISQGQAQSVMVSKEDAMTNFIRLVSDFSLENSKETQTAFLNRLSYIDYFSSCLSYVPVKMPHENGGLTMNAFKHVFLPRLFFPDKAVIDESTHLTKYTGVFYSNIDMGVSFGLGYVPDFYIDYGYIFMFPILILFGYFIGNIFLDIYNHAGSILWGISMMAISFSLLFRFENSMIKLFGQLIMIWLVYRLFEWFVLPIINKKVR